MFNLKILQKYADACEAYDYFPSNYNVMSTITYGYLIDTLLSDNCDDSAEEVKKIYDTISNHFEYLPSYLSPQLNRKTETARNSEYLFILLGIKGHPSILSKLASWFATGKNYKKNDLLAEFCIQKALISIKNSEEKSVYQQYKKKFQHYSFAGYNFEDILKKNFSEDLLVKFANKIYPKKKISIIVQKLEQDWKNSPNEIKKFLKQKSDASSSFFRMFFESKKMTEKYKNKKIPDHLNFLNV